MFRYIGKRALLRLSQGILYTMVIIFFLVQIPVMQLNRGIRPECDPINEALVAFKGKIPKKFLKEAAIYVTDGSDNNHTGMFHQPEPLPLSNTKPCDENEEELYRSYIKTLKPVEVTYFIADMSHFMHLTLFEEEDAEGPVFDSDKSVCYNLLFEENTKPEYGRLYDAILLRFSCDNSFPLMGWAVRSEDRQLHEAVVKSMCENDNKVVEVKRAGTKKIYG